MQNVFFFFQQISKLLPLFFAWSLLLSLFHQLYSSVRVCSMELIVIVTPRLTNELPTKETFVTRICS